MAGGSVTVEQPGPELPAEASTKMPAACVLFTMVSSSLGGAAFAGRATPAVVHHVRAQGGVGVVAVQVGGCDEELEALCVAWRECRCPTSMLRQPIHFAPGATPIWLPAPSSPDCRAGGVRAVALVIAGGSELLAARVAAAAVDGVVPVIVMVGGSAVPAR